MHASSAVWDVMPCLPVLAGDRTTRTGPGVALASLSLRRPTLPGTYLSNVWKCGKPHCIKVRL